MHPLDRYFEATGVGPEDLIGRMKKRGHRPTTVEYLRMLRGGWRHPSRKLARSISATTDGQVSVAELLEYERPPSEASPRKASRRKASRKRRSAQVRKKAS
jgi:hypothetical protein